MWTVKDRVIAVVVLYASTAAISWLFGWAVSLAFSCGLVNYDDVILDYVIDHGCPSVSNCTSVIVTKAHAHANDVAFGACFKYCSYAVAGGVCIATLVIIVYWTLRLIKYCQEKALCDCDLRHPISDIVHELQAKREYYRSPSVRPLSEPFIGSPQRVMIAQLTAIKTVESDPLVL